LAAFLGRDVLAHPNPVMRVKASFFSLSVVPQGTASSLAYLSCGAGPVKLKSREICPSEDVLVSEVEVQQVLWIRVEDAF